MGELTNIVDGDSAAAVVRVLAVLLQRVLVPPSLLQCLQCSLIQEFQDPGEKKELPFVNEFRGNSMSFDL